MMSTGRLSGGLDVSRLVVCDLPAKKNAGDRNDEDGKTMQSRPRSQEGMPEKDELNARNGLMNE